MGQGGAPGDLAVPDGATAVVLFAHGSGSGRHSPRNQAVAAALNQHGLATMLTDLLTEPEEQAEAHTRHLRFDIDLLTERLQTASAWLERDPSTSHLPLCYFGASTGAAAALAAAATTPERVRAVVSRGGRPDLAHAALASVRAPTLLIVGSLDTTVLALNRAALDELQCERDMAVVEGATHLFEEPGALDEVARLAGDWFERHVRT